MTNNFFEKQLPKKKDKEKKITCTLSRNSLIASYIYLNFMITP